MHLFPSCCSYPISTPRTVVRKRSHIAESVVCVGRRSMYTLNSDSITVFEISYFKTLRNSIIRGEQLGSTFSGYGCYVVRKVPLMWKRKITAYPTRTLSCCPWPYIHSAKILFLNEYLSSLQLGSFSNL